MIRGRGPRTRTSSCSEQRFLPPRRCGTPHGTRTPRPQTRPLCDEGQHADGVEHPTVLYQPPVVYGLQGLSALASTLLPEHPALGASRSTIAQSRLSGSCGDRFSWVCSGCAWGEFGISRSAVRIAMLFYGFSYENPFASQGGRGGSESEWGVPAS